MYYLTSALVKCKREAKEGEEVEFDHTRPIYMQVIEDIKLRIIRGELKVGDKLPSTRELAMQYQINPNTASRIYNELEQEGFCYTKRGLGTFITEDETMIIEAKETMAEKLIEDCINGLKQLNYSENEVIALFQKRLESRK